MDIYEYEEAFVQATECQDNNYYLSAVMKDSDGELIMDYRVDPKIFFTFDYEDVVDYAKTSNPNSYISNNLEVVQVVFKDDLYTVVMKTYWLKVFQRTWRNYLNNRDVARKYKRE
jgi:hypothetical protein